MNKIIVVIWLVLGVGLYGQDSTSLYDNLYFVDGTDTIKVVFFEGEMDTMVTLSDTVAVDTSYADLCSERGHVRSVVSKTLMYCGGPYLEDERDYTVMVYPGCNYYEYRCLRCDTLITEKEETVRDTIWRRY